MRFSVRSRLKIILFIQEVFELRTMTTEEQRKTNGGYKIYEYYRCDTCKKGVDFRYGNRDLVLDKLDMVFKNGRKTAIVGKSGCGKTTLAKLLLSFYSPEQGSALDFFGTKFQELLHTAFLTVCSRISEVSVTLSAVSIVIVVDFQMIAAVTAFQKSRQPRMIGICIVRDTLVMGFLVLNGKPYARIDQPLMIPDLNKSHPRTSMNKYTVDTVIRFNIIEYLIALVWKASATLAAIVSRSNSAKFSRLFRIIRPSFVSVLKGSERE